MKKILRSLTPSKSRPKQLFGKKLSELVGTQVRLPSAVESWMLWLEKHALEVQGLFRISPSKKILEDTKARYNEGHDYALNDSSDPHLVAGLLKNFIQQLPNPICGSSFMSTQSKEGFLFKVGRHVISKIMFFFQSR